MSKSKLDENSMLSELSGSAFFRDRTPIPKKYSSKLDNGMGRTTEGSKIQVSKGSADQQARRSEDQEAEISLNLNKIADIRRGHDFTEEELNEIEDLKRDLRRKYGFYSSVSDVVRVGVHIISEDFHKNGEVSMLVTRLRKKSRK